jgi:hypothetical protein
MKSFLRHRGPTIAVAALMFVAGGATVTTAQNLITSADIQNGQVKTADLANGAVATKKIAKNAVNSKKIVNLAVANADLANNAVSSKKIASGAVANGDLASNAVNSAKIASGGVANADLANNAVNSAKIQDGQVTTADLANGGVANADLANNAVNSAKIQDGQVTTADIANGTIAIGDVSPAAQTALSAVYSGPNWGVMHRNVIGNGDSYLQAGPGFVQVGDPPNVTVEITPAPLGVGSLGLRTGAGTDKAAFGNALDFIGDPVAELTEVSFHVFTTGENIDVNPANLPNISIEILANLTPNPGDYTTMVFTPPNTAIPGWHEFDATTLQNWWLTGAEGTTTGCTQATMCTLQEVKDRLDDGGTQALIGTVGIAKGTDFAFSGAVDALRINDTVYDFEPNGVFPTPAG